MKYRGWFPALAPALVTQSIVKYAHTLSEEHYMKLKVIIHEAEEGGYWAEVPAIPGCVTQGETFDELLGNIYEAVEGCLSIASSR